MEPENPESSSNCNGEVVMNGHHHHDDYDEVDGELGGRVRSASGGGGAAAEGTQAVSGSTQTDDFEFDTVDARAARIPLRINGVCSNNNGSSASSSNRNKDGGILSNLITMVLPTKRKHEPEDLDNEGTPRSLGRNVRCMSTQTEESPASVRAHELCCMVIQELALENPVPSSERDEVFEALCCCVCEILDKHSILFNGMLRRFEVTDFRVFSCIANELFEVSSTAPEFKITWGRVVSLFAFAIRLAQKHKEAHEEDKLDNVVQYLSNYISKHLLDFVVEEGGWEGLVKQFPLPDTEEKQVKRAMMWSGLCVGLVATMYVSSFLSK